MKAKIFERKAILKGSSQSAVMSVSLLPPCSEHTLTVLQKKVHPGPTEWPALIIPACSRQGQESWGCKPTLGYTGNSRPAWATGIARTCLENKRKSSFGLQILEVYVHNSKK